MFSPVESVWKACVLIPQHTYNCGTVLRVLCSQQSNANRSLQLLAYTLLLTSTARYAHRTQWDRCVHHVFPDRNEDDSPRTDLQSQDGLDVVHKRLGQDDQKRKRTRMGLHGTTELWFTR